MESKLSDWLRSKAPGTFPRTIPVKMFILWLEMAAQDSNPLDKLIEKLESWFSSLNY